MGSASVTRREFKALIATQGSLRPWSRVWLCSEKLAVWSLFTAQAELLN